MSLATKRRLTVTLTVEITVDDTRPMSPVVAGAISQFLAEPDIAAGQPRDLPTLYDIDGARVTVTQQHVNTYFDALGKKVELP